MILFGHGYHSIVRQNEVSNLEIPRHFMTSFLLLKVLDHHRIAVPHLVLPPSVGDREALGALLDAVSALVTHHAGQEVSVNLGHLVVC